MSKAAEYEGSICPMPTSECEIQRRRSTAGTGCFVQLIGIAVGLLLIVLIPLLGWVLGPLLILAALVWGGRLATYYECSNCRNPLASNRVRLCPTCGAHLS